MSKRLDLLKAIPQRGAAWMGKVGPLASWGLTPPKAHSYSNVMTLLDAQQRMSAAGSSNLCTSDYYAQLQITKPPNPVLPPKDGVLAMPVLDVGNWEDIDVSTGGTAMAEEVRAGAACLSEKGYVPVVVGGDNSITKPVLEGIQEIANKEEVILVHFDSRPDMDECSSPAGAVQPSAAMRQIMEGNKLVKGILQFGTRCVSPQARAFRSANPAIKYVDMNFLYQRGIHTLKDIRNDHPVYISIDLNVLDPFYTTGNGSCHRDSGGMTPRELLHLIGILRARRVVGMDIVGYNPRNVVPAGGNVAAGLSGEAALAGLVAKTIVEGVMKTYTMSPMTSSEGLKYVEEQKQAGAHPARP